MQITLSVSRPMQLCYADGITKVIVNNETKNVALLGFEQGAMQQGDPETFPLGPLNVAAIDGSLPYWGIGLTGPVNVLVLEGGIYWAPSPVQTFDQLTLAGFATESTMQEILAYLKQAIPAPT